MKLCAIETKELEDKVLTRFAENQNDELLEDLSDYIINSQKEIERLNIIIDKAIEYLEQPYRDNFDFSKAELIEILKGSDKE